MSTPDRPERMYRGDRPVDAVFDEQESLYRRFKPPEGAGSNIEIGNIPFYPAMSTNRERYSQPEDVLYPEYFALCGVYAFPVGCVPARYEDVATETAYEWRVVHAPEADNYAHTEVRTLKESVFDNQLNIGSKKIKKWFREKLSDHIRVVIEQGQYAR